jgi:hypothetical protein
MQVLPRFAFGGFPFPQGQGQGQGFSPLPPTPHLFAFCFCLVLFGLFTRSMQGLEAFAIAVVGVFVFHCPGEVLRAQVPFNKFLPQAPSLVKLVLVLVAWCLLVFSCRRFSNASLRLPRFSALVRVFRIFRLLPPQIVGPVVAVLDLI